ncbi:unnamed protein product [Schistosoma mattheei]|uniref:Uncharacterized protein n=1 Tax=Schistosoma mattheei TaxID=31246 RepID=A0A183P274_9TREM|nr:unnamed protein product [Schistosoma mattheei]
MREPGEGLTHSDHHLVVAKMKLKPKKHCTVGEIAVQRFDTAFLRDTNKLNQFKITSNNRFQASQHLLEEEKTTMEDKCKGIKEALTSKRQEVLCYKKHHYKEWISMETLDKIRERKNMKKAINNSQPNKCKESQSTGQIHRSKQASEEEHQNQQVQISKGPSRDSE